jgi:hypothetical protein
MTGLFAVLGSSATCFIMHAADKLTATYFPYHWLLCQLISKIDHGNVVPMEIHLT